MDALSYAAVARAHDALTMALQDEHAENRRTDAQLKRKAYVEYAARLALGTLADASPLLRRFMQQKAAVAASSRDEVLSVDGSGLSAHWLASIASGSLLDAARPHVMALPPTVHRVLLATGYVASDSPQGTLKVLDRLSFAPADVEPAKVATIVTMTRELLNAGEEVFLRAVGNELARAVGRASNAAFLAAAAGISGGTLALSSTGDVLSDLRLGLRESDSDGGIFSTAYLVAADPGKVADLATRAEAGPGFSVAGGTFRPGIEVVPVENHVGLTILPLGRLALWDSELQLRQAEHATLVMDDAPTGDSTTPTGFNAAGQNVVNLWQTNSIGLLAERSFHLAGDLRLVTVS